MVISLSSLTFVLLKLAIPVLVLLVFLAWNLWVRASWIKLSRQSQDAIWEKIDEAELSSSLEKYAARQSVPLQAAGFQPAGAWLAAANPKFKTHAVCFLHPQGHYIVEIIQLGGQCTLEAVSFLDDGSVVSTIATDVEMEHFSGLAASGYLVQICKLADMRALTARHEAAIQETANTPNVWLRKLTASNWRDYMIYSQRHFNKCMFELGKKDNPPPPFRFPDGKCVEVTAPAEALV